MSASANTHETRAPLTGRSVVVTRSAEQAADLALPLEALGAEVIVMPVIEIIEPENWTPVDAAIAGLEKYEWAIFTSTNAVVRFLERLRVVRGDAGALAGMRVAAVGESTRRELEDAGVAVEITPADARAEGLVAEFERSGVAAGSRVLIPRALKAREILPEALRAAGAEVDVVVVYRTVPTRPSDDVLARLKAGAPDAVTFTSGSTVKHFIAALESVGLDAEVFMRDAALASIGPVTTAALEKRGYRADIEAPEATMASLASAVAAHFSA